MGVRSSQRDLGGYRPPFDRFERSTVQKPGNLEAISLHMISLTSRFFVPYNPSCLGIMPSHMFEAELVKTEIMMDTASAAMTEIEGKPPKDKRAKFVELAQSRTTNAIRAIRVIGKLGNKSAYQYDEADVRKIVTALSREIDALKSRLAQTTGKDEVEFKL